MADPTRRRGRTDSGRVLSDLRVVDLSMGWAGPLAAMLLADFGAQIVKIESTRHLDWWRGGGVITGVDDVSYEKSARFNAVNRNKFGITLDLNDRRAKAILSDLIAASDILVENFTPRVMNNLGLTYDSVRKINPTLIMISMPGFGSSGPWRDYAGFGNTIESLSGIASLTGYPDGPPILCSNAYGDPVSGIGGAIALMMALVHRCRTGEGQHIEMSHQELVVHHVAPSLLDYAMNGRVAGRQGNRHSWMAPHGVYPCSGEDQWLAIAVGSDREWADLCRSMGHAEMVDDPRFINGLSRWDQQDELDELVSGWTFEWEKQELADLLQRAGVAAAPVNSSVEVLDDAHVKARRSFTWMDRQHVGSHPYPSVTVDLKATPGVIHKSAPCLGEDNAFVLGEIAGVPQDDMDFLTRDGVIGDRPDAG